MAVAVGLGYPGTQGEMTQLGVSFFIQCFAEWIRVIFGECCLGGVVCTGRNVITPLLQRWSGLGHPATQGEMRQLGVSFLVQCVPERAEQVQDGSESSLESVAPAMLSVQGA